MTALLRPSRNLAHREAYYTTMEIRESRYQPESHQDAHVHDFTAISLLIRGRVDERTGRGTHSGVAGDVVVRPAGIVHEDSYGFAGAKTFGLALHDADVGDYRWLRGGSAPALLARAVAEWREGEPFGEIAVDLLASIHEGATPARPGQMREVADRVETTGISVDALARELSMHPVSLARAFRRAHGCSITWYRRRSRVRRAADLLTTAMPLADVAMESGFTDQSHFCRVFKVEMGLTPSVYRRLAV